MRTRRARRRLSTKTIKRKMAELQAIRQHALPDDFDTKLARVEAQNEEYRGFTLLRLHEGDYLVLDPRGIRSGEGGDLAHARRIVDAILGD